MNVDIKKEDIDEQGANREAKISQENKWLCASKTRRTVTIAKDKVITIHYFGLDKKLHKTLQVFPIGN